VLIADSMEEAVVKFNRWKGRMESKDLCVNVNKTRWWSVVCWMWCCSGKWPCAVSMKGVGRNLIMCCMCDGWVHKRYRGVYGIVEPHS